MGLRSCRDMNDGNCQGFTPNATGPALPPLFTGDVEIQIPHPVGRVANRVVGTGTFEVREGKGLLSLLSGTLTRIHDEPGSLADEEEKEAEE